MIVAVCNPRRGNWKSMLLMKVGTEHSVVARFEHHDSHPGLHVHSHCDRSGIEVGASSLDRLVRVPPVGLRHRRQNAWTLSTFWAASRKFYRAVDNLGPLFGHEA